MIGDVGIVGESQRFKGIKEGGWGGESQSIQVRHVGAAPFCHDSLFNLFSSSSTSSPPLFPFSITGHLHLLIELFCH